MLCKAHEVAGIAVRTLRELWVKQLRLVNQSHRSPDGRKVNERECGVDGHVFSMNTRLATKFLDRLCKMNRSESSY